MKHNVRQHHWLTRTMPRGPAASSGTVAATETSTQDEPDLPRALTHARTHTRTAATRQVRCYRLSPSLKSRFLFLGFGTKLA